MSHPHWKQSFLPVALALAPLHTYAQTGPQASTMAKQEQATVTEILVSSRRREELAQDVPIPLSVISGEDLETKGVFNISRLVELQPNLQFYSSNPRNTAINIRGLGAPFGLTNDGIEPGVGVYVDQIYHARPASTTFDFIDVERVEVLRGPQGTLYGKNTTSGAINVTTRAPQFSAEGKLELSYGDLGFQQARGYVTGPLARDLAGRLSFSSTQREGSIENLHTGRKLNDLNNVGVRGQLLYEITPSLSVTLHSDYNRQRTACCTQIFAGVAPTLRSPARQYAGIAADLNFAPPSENPFDRVTDLDSPIRAEQELGGLGLVTEQQLSKGTLTAVTAWRYWNWYPSNDRDFTSLPITTVSANPSKQRQWTQELRYDADLGDRIHYVAGLLFYRQTIDSTGIQRQGSAASRWLLAPAVENTPELLDGLARRNQIQFANNSSALFTQLDWQLSSHLSLHPGLRVNHDSKETDFDSAVTGGLAADDPVLIARKNSVLASQTYRAHSSDSDLSGQLTTRWRFHEHLNIYATAARSFKSVGVNLSGIPNDASGKPALSAAEVAPEKVRHLEIGLKSTALRGRLRTNVNVFDTVIRDYQANVVNNAVGVLRGYLANAEEVEVAGAELEIAAQLSRNLSLYWNASYTEGRYNRFADAPCPLELTGAANGGVCDVSGTILPGISRVSGSAGGEYSRATSLAGTPGEAYIGVDISYRSDFSSSASRSHYLMVDGYSLSNVRAGYRSDTGNWEVFAWVRNAFDEEYFEFLSAQPGSSGMYVGQLGDPRTAGVSLSLRF